MSIILVYLLINFKFRYLPESIAIVFLGKILKSELSSSLDYFFSILGVINQLLVKEMEMLV